MSDTNKPIDPKHKKLLLSRGKGCGRDYEPFIKVHEFSSQGESVRIRSATVGRIHHLLSGIELHAFLIFDQYQQTVDIREQFPIDVEDTLELCSQLGIRHPQVRGKLTVVTTDLLIDFADGTKLAIAVKQSSELVKPRVIEKLQIEKSYWEARNIQWKVFTEREVSDASRENLLWIQPFLSEENSLHHQISVDDIQALLSRISDYPHKKITRLCANLDDIYGVEPGYHLTTLRYAIAKRFISGQMNKPFHSWTYEDLKIRNVHLTEVSHNAS